MNKARQHFCQRANPLNALWDARPKLGKHGLPIDVKGYNLTVRSCVRAAAALVQRAVQKIRATLTPCDPAPWSQRS